MKKNLFLMFIVILLFTISCGPKKSEKKEYNLKIYDNETLISTTTYEENTNIDLTNIEAPTKNHYKFIGYVDEEGNKISALNITNDISIYLTYELIPFVSFSLKGSLNITDGSSVKYTVEFEEESTVVKPTFSINNKEVADITQSGRNYCWVEAYQTGDVTLTATYENYSTSIDIVVGGATYNLNYQVEDDDKELIEKLPTTYNTEDFPYTLPVLSREGFFFNGWKIGGYTGVYTTISYESKIRGDLNLSPVWSYPHLDVSYNKDYPIIGIDEEFSINVLYYEIPASYEEAYVLSSANIKIAKIVDNKIIGVANGYTEIKVSLKDHPNINISFGLNVNSDVNTLNEVLLYFAEISKTPIITKTIDVVTWQKTYKQDLLTSVVPFLFEDLDIIENIAPPTSGVRPGTIKQKYYVCVHDTADLAYSAQKWSETVYNGAYDNGTKYEASFQYVVGNDGIYHNIPDNEVAWHAGDGTKVSYTLYPTNVFGTNKHPVIGIDTDGYYTIDGVSSIVKAPTNNGKILTSDVINDYGVRCVIGEKSEYFLGASYYNDTYRRIANYAGNNNSIGIESCLNEGTDVFYTWQKLSKLVAYLLDVNELSIDDVEPHHYYSGKDCPQTMRKAGMWDYFKDMIMIEYQVREYQKLGYQISFEPLDKTYINDVGRIIKWPKVTTTVKFKVIVSKDAVSDEITLGVNIPGSNILK